jgi:hypothetical protein
LLSHIDQGVHVLPVGRAGNAQSNRVHLIGSNSGVFAGLVAQRPFSCDSQHVRPNPAGMRCKVLLKFGHDGMDCSACACCDDSREDLVLVFFRIDRMARYAT